MIFIAYSSTAELRVGNQRLKPKHEVLKTRQGFGEARRSLVAVCYFCTNTFRMSVSEALKVFVPERSEVYNASCASIVLYMRPEFLLKATVSG